MRHLTLAFALASLFATGCTDDTSRLDRLEAASPAGSPSTATLSASLDAETAARKLGDSDTLAAAKAYTDGQSGSGLSTKLDAETAARIAGEAAAKAYTDAAVAKVTVPTELHLIADGAGPNGAPLDLGRSAGDAFALATIGGKNVLVYRAANFVVRFVNDDCTGAPYFLPPIPSIVGNARYVAGGKLYRVQSGQATQVVTVGVLDGAGKCVKDGLNFFVIPAAATGDTATAYDPTLLHVDPVATGS